jgi:hypothetical protein
MQGAARPEKDICFMVFFHVPVCSSGSAVDFTIKELRALEFPQWRGLAAITFGNLVIPDEVQTLTGKIQGSTLPEQEETLELSQFAPVGGG